MLLWVTWLVSAHNHIVKKTYSWKTHVCTLYSSKKRVPFPKWMKSRFYQQFISLVIRFSKWAVHCVVQKSLFVWKRHKCLHLELQPAGRLSTHSVGNSTPQSLSAVRCVSHRTKTKKTLQVLLGREQMRQVQHNWIRLELLILNILPHEARVTWCIKEFIKEEYSSFTLMKCSVGGKMPKQMDKRIQPRKKLPRFEFSWSCLQIWQ